VTLGELRDCYGILIPEGQKFSRPPKADRYIMKSFELSFKEGDSIGVLLEFKADKKGELSFFKNGETIGNLFSDIKEGVYYPCLSLNGGNNVVLLNSSARMPNLPYRAFNIEQVPLGG